MVLQVGKNVLLYNLYILPETTDWRLYLECDPLQVLASSFVLAVEAGYKIAIVGDANARMENRVAATHHEPHLSPDVGPASTRGQWLCATLGIYNLMILNSIRRFAPHGSHFTSFQGDQRTVIDYAICSTDLLHQIRDFCVLPLDREWSDHMALDLTVQMNMDGLLTTRVSPYTRKHHRIQHSMSNETEIPKNSLDILVEHLLKKADNMEEHLVHSFGRVYANSGTLKCVVHASCSEDSSPESDRHATMAVYVGLNAKLNTIHSLSGIQTLYRAFLWGILLALYKAPQDRALEIACCSLSTLDVIMYRAHIDQMCGWRCTDGDVLKRINNLIQVRTAPIHFVHLEKNSTSGHLREAIALLQKPISQHDEGFIEDSVLILDTAPPMSETTLPFDCLKVTANFPDSCHDHKDSQEESTQNRTHQREEYPAPHQGRHKARELQDKNRRDLLDTAEMSNTRFWKILRKLGDPVKETASVSADDLKMVFEQRLNPPNFLPPDFDEIQHKLNSMRASMIPDRTQDHSTGKYFFSLWKGEEIADLKEHIRKWSLMDSAFSDDGVLYLHIMNIENNDLAELFNRCIQDMDVPLAWLRIIMIGTLKRGKEAGDPESYRLLGIESCFFRFFSLGIHMRTTSYPNIRMGSELVTTWTTICSSCDVP